jgi:oligogalacturonide transport system substrate-binding protein
MTLLRHPLAILSLALGLASHSALADTTLRFSWWGGKDRHELTQKAIALFEAKNPGVKIKPEYSAFRGYEQNLNQQISAGNQPDIMQVNWAWLPAMTRQQDAVLDLYKYRQHLDLAAFPNESFKSGLVFGRLSGLPTSYTAMVFLWNKNTFDRAGLPLPKTWAQLMQAGQVFKTKLGNDYYPLANDAQSLILLSHAYIQQKTGKPYIYSNQAKVALTQEELRDWANFYSDLFRNHVVMTHQEKAAQQLGNKAVQQLQEWSNGKWAGNYTWDSTMSLRQSGWALGTRGDLGDFLTMAGARNSGMYGRPSVMLAVSKNTKNPDIAVKFVNFMTTDPEAGKILGTTRGTPMAKTQFDVLQKGNLIQGLEQKAYQQITANKLEYPSPLFEHSKMQTMLRQVFEALGRGQITEDQAAAQLLNEGNQILKSIK